MGNLDDWILPNKPGTEKTKNGFEDFVNNIKWEDYVPDISKEQIEKLKEEAINKEEMISKMVSSITTTLLLILMSNIEGMPEINIPDVLNPKKENIE